MKRLHEKQEHWVEKSSAYARIISVFVLKRADSEIYTFKKMFCLFKFYSANFQSVLQKSRGRALDLL